jgi:thiazole/oxazole-forming peptide maturase SagD family component
MFAPMAAQEAERLLADETDVSPALSAVAGRLDRLFRIDAPEAPGLALVGGVIALSENQALAMGAPAVSVTGNGFSVARALVSCLGEAADILSQFEHDDDVTEAATTDMRLEGWIKEALPLGITRLDMMAGRYSATGEPVRVPADLCLRRPPARRIIEPVGALSAGCAAGRDPAMAQERAILELIERDAAALWWLGGIPPREMAVDAGTGDLLRQLRGDVTRRVTRLLDLTADIGVPVIAACSHDPEGLGLACGVAARRSAAEAARAAIQEMAQMELAAPLARMKAAGRGEASLNDTDRRTLARAAMHAPSCVLLDASETAGSPDLTAGSPAGHLKDRGLDVFTIDLTRRDIAVPVIRALAPGLQPFSARVVTPRLAAAIARTGGGAAHHRGVMSF